MNLRAPMVLARVLGERDGRARQRPPRLHVLAVRARSATPRSSVYSATKFGLRGFAQSLREDLRPSGVGVSAIFPGFVRDAGMFHDTGTKLPPGVGTRSPEDVADAVVRAIERNRGEVDVAPVSLRAGAMAAGLAPDLAAIRAAQARRAADRRGPRRAQTDKR